MKFSKSNNQYVDSWSYCRIAFVSKVKASWQTNSFNASEKEFKAEVFTTVIEADF